MQNTTLSPRELFNAAYKIGTALGRKFEVSDMTFALRQAAHQYAAQYECRKYGDEFMADMVKKVAYHEVLSDGQAKGILNVLMADARRRMAAKAAPAAPMAAAPAANLTNLPDGRYRVTLEDNSDRALMIRKSDWAVEKFGEGARMISLRTGSDEWTGQGVVLSTGLVKFFSKAGQAVKDSVNVLAQATVKGEWLVLGQAFAQIGSQCFICGRDLDTRESLAVGYGPICAEKNGLPWGDKATPLAAPSAPVAAPSVDPIEEEAAAWEAVIDAQKVEAPIVKNAKTIGHKEAHARNYTRTYEEIFGTDDDS